MNHTTGSSYPCSLTSYPAPSFAGIVSRIPLLLLRWTCWLKNDLMCQDVSSKSSGRLLARGFVSHKTLRGLQGYISSSLISPQLEQVRPTTSCFLLNHRRPVTHDHGSMHFKGGFWGIIAAEDVMLHCAENWRRTLPLKSVGKHDVGVWAILMECSIECSWLFSMNWGNIKRGQVGYIQSLASMP